MNAKLFERGGGVAVRLRLYIPKLGGGGGAVHLQLYTKTGGGAVHLQLYTKTGGVNCFEVTVF